MMNKEDIRITMNHIYKRIDYIEKIHYIPEHKWIHYTWYNTQFGYRDSMMSSRINPKKANRIIDLVKTLIGEGYHF